MNNHWGKLIAALFGVTVSLGILLVFVVQSNDETTEHQLDIESRLAALAEEGRPFSFTILSIDDSKHDWGPQVVINLQATNEIADDISRDDLQRLWKLIATSIGDRRMFLYVRNEVPDSLPCGLISRIKGGGIEMDGDWEMEFSLPSTALY